MRNFVLTTGCLSSLLPRQHLTVLFHRLRCYTHHIRAKVVTSTLITPSALLISSISIFPWDIHLPVPVYSETIHSSFAYNYLGLPL
jgi:hypothetical protein